MTVQQAYQQVTSQLYKLYEPREAAAIANFVIEYITGFGNSRRIVNKAIALNEEQESLFQQAAIELSAGKPLQYVLHEAPFYGLKLYVDENVLIPRPETEELVHWVIDEAGSYCLQFTVPCSMLDIGTGSGCIPIAVKKHLPTVNAHAIDVSATALSVAKKNAAKYNTAIHFHQLDISDKSLWQQLPQFNIIVSNPPYITQKEAAAMHRNVLQHEPHLALFVPDTTPLLFYETIAVFGLQHLSSNGALFFEINEVYGTAISELLVKNGYTNIELRKDMQGKDRMIRGQLLR